MNVVSIDLEALRHNLAMIGRWMERLGASWSVVTKSLCAHEDTLRALRLLGVRSVADSRLENLEVVDRVIPGTEKWYLRLPVPSVVPDVVRLADVSLNSEVAVIEALNAEAARQQRVHRVVIMIELGDLREGILPGSLVRFYERVFELPHIEVLGIGGQVGCLAGAVPSVDQMMQLVLYKELLELKFGRPLPLISAGSSVSLTLLVEDRPLPPQLNHYRIGESLFLGTDLVHGGTLRGLRDDVVLLEAEIAEIKEKSLVPLGETGAHTPFEPAGAEGDEGGPSPGQRGYRALVTVGQLDTDVQGLAPVEADHQVAGASSDVTVVNLGRNRGNLRVGDRIRFRPSYSAFVRLMSSQYVERKVWPPLAAFEEALAGRAQATAVPPAVEAVGTTTNGTTGDATTGHGGNGAGGDAGVAAWVTERLAEGSLEAAGPASRSSGTGSSR